MRVFVTGASGWIGSATVDELLAAGHEVTGLARSDASAAAVAAKGAHVMRGDLDDLASIRAGAEAAEAVIHLANKHDWADMAGTAAAERAAVQAIGDVLAGSERPFLLASGVAALTKDRPATEDENTPPVTRYVDSGGIHIAYQVLGAGQRDIVFVPGAMSHLDLLWEDPETAAFFRRLATLGRLILFDKRDTGLSDRAGGDSPLTQALEAAGFRPTPRGLRLRAG